VPLLVGISTPRQGLSNSRFVGLYMSLPQDRHLLELTRVPNARATCVGKGRIYTPPFIIGTFEEGDLRHQTAWGHHLCTFDRAMLCIRVLSMGLCLCLCLSVCPDHTNNTTRYPWDSSFLMPKISAKFDRGHPLRERRMQVGWSKSATFDK